jgi:Ribbon-helix-helix protein, copG family
MVRPKRNAKKRARPAVGQEPVSALRVSRELTAAIDKWAAETDASSRSEAIRRLIEQALAASQPMRKRAEKSALDARGMATRALEGLTDRSLSAEEQERRKRRLTKGPQEFAKCAAISRSGRPDMPGPACGAV